MKLVELFRDFLRDTVNLNQSRIDLLDDSVGALKTFLRGSDWTPKIVSFEEQGSWAHDTIIKPVEGGEFDADLLVLVKPVEGWTAADFVTSLGTVFKESGTYADMVKVWDYCVTITYAGDRKIDLAPCVVDRLGATTLEVCNREADRFDRSEPIEYTKWMRRQNGFSGSNSFRKATRLLKYLRDIKGTFTCPSVLLTTLIGERISFLDQNSQAFADTPTTLQTIVARLDDWLQARPSRPVVHNPSMPSEDFGQLWTDDQYANFRNVIHRYRGWVDEAMSTEGRDESIKAWQRIFGDEFAKGKVVKAAADGALGTSLVTEALARASRFLDSTAAHASELVDVVKTYGLSALPPTFNRPKHLQPPRWPAASALALVEVSALWYPKRYSGEGTPIVPGTILPARGGLWFEVHTNRMQGVPPGCEVHWRIANTGIVAFVAKVMRGGFYSPDGSGTGRWEDLRYRGVHIAEAFVTRDGILVGQSAPFNVVIE